MLAGALVGPIIIGFVWVVQTQPRLQAIEAAVQRIEVDRAVLVAKLEEQHTRMDAADTKLAEAISAVRMQLARAEARDEMVIASLASITNTLRDRGFHSPLTVPPGYSSGKHSPSLRQPPDYEP